VPADLAKVKSRSLGSCFNRCPRTKAETRPVLMGPFDDAFFYAFDLEIIRLLADKDGTRTVWMGRVLCIENQDHIFRTWRMELVSSSNIRRHSFHRKLMARDAKAFTRRAKSAI